MKRLWVLFWLEKIKVDNCNVPGTDSKLPSFVKTVPNPLFNHFENTYRFSERMIFDTRALGRAFEYEGQL